jgi:hypothetical protein
MNSGVVDYKRLKRVEVDYSDEKFNLNHLVMLLVALFVMYIFKRIKDKQSDQLH